MELVSNIAIGVIIFLVGCIFFLVAFRKEECVDCKKYFRVAKMHSYKYCEEGSPGDTYICSCCYDHRSGTAGCE